MRRPLSSGEEDGLEGSLPQPRRHHRDHLSSRHSKSKPRMNHGRDREHPIELDDDGESEFKSSRTGRRRRSKDPTHTREPLLTIDLTPSRGLTPPPRTYNRFDPPREPRSPDADTPSRRHRKKHRDSRHNRDRQRTEPQEPVHQPHEVMGADLGREAPQFNPQWQAVLPVDGGVVDDLGNLIHPQMPDLGLGEDHGLDEAFWGHYLAHEPPFHDGEPLAHWRDFDIPRENVHHQDPPQYRLGADEALGVRSLSPVGEDEYPLDYGSSDSASVTSDVQYIREATVSFDDQALEDACMAKILELFPDICRDHVRKLYQDRKEQDFKYRAIRDDRRNYDPSEVLIQNILEGAYPKQKDSKRKRPLSFTGSGEGDKENWVPVEGQGDKEYLHFAGVILQEEFPHVPHSFIKQQLAEKKSLYLVYLAVAETEGSFDSAISRLYQRLKTPRKPKFGYMPTGEMEREYRGYGPTELTKELQLARTARKKQEAKIQTEKDAQAAEALNEREHMENGAMMECQCCFSDAPINRTVYCNGDDPHFFCFDCARSQASNEIGKMRYQLKCMDGSICSGTLTTTQLARCLDKKTLIALERLQQQEEIRLAGFEDLSECPFCDYKAIYPPVDVDKEFRCGNPECERVSCRLCNEETHIPMSCEENKKERHLPARHAIEEAMTDALIRTCPSCKTSIVKEAGCNKMTCSRCFKLMCYICRQDITDQQYNHFTNSKCQVYDNNTEKLHQDDVAAAEKKALEKAKKENPAIPEEELKIKMNADVNKTAHPTMMPGLRGALNMMGADGAHWQRFNEINNMIAGGGYVAAQRQAQGVHQAAPRVVLGPAAAQPVPYQFGQWQPNYAPPIPHPPPAQGPRGRFPVVPFMPGRFGDVVHHPPLGPGWDGRGVQPMAFGGPPPQMNWNLADRARPNAHPVDAGPRAAPNAHDDLVQEWLVTPADLGVRDDAHVGGRRRGDMDFVDVGRRDGNLRRANTERSHRRNR